MENAAVSSDFKTDEACIAEVRAGHTASFEPLILRYQSRVFATVRKYARREGEVQDIAQEIFLKAFQKLDTFRGESPFEHWLMRLAVRTCFDSLRRHQRNREHTIAELSDEESDWLQQMPDLSEVDPHRIAAARELVHKIMETLPPHSRLVITLLEIEERSLKEIASLTGWSIPLIKVRAFRARQLLKKALAKIEAKKYL